MLCPCTPLLPVRRAASAKRRARRLSEQNANKQGGVDKAIGLWDIDGVDAEQRMDCSLKS